MRINVLQHTPNEGPGAIKTWAQERNHELFVYHPYHFYGVLPTAEETDLLVILGGPMSPNNDFSWIQHEQKLIKELLDAGKPIFGACFGAQQIAKSLNCSITKAPYKEVGWAPVYLHSDRVQGLPSQLTVLHWHEDMFAIPEQAQLLFSSDLVRNQGFLYKQNVVGLQFHLEPEIDDIREIVINDTTYPLHDNALNQDANDILKKQNLQKNKETLCTLLDYITGSNID